MKFGLTPRKKTTGAELGLYFLQIISLLPAIYILIASGYMALFTKKGILSFLCSLGFSAVPRAEALGLSWLYRATSSEAAVCFGLLLTAIAAGIVVKKLFRSKEKTAFVSRVCIAVLLGADLILSLVPMSFNLSFGIAAAVCGFVLRLGCLALTIADVAVYKKEKAASAGDAAAQQDAT